MLDLYSIQAQEPEDHECPGACEAPAAYEALACQLEDVKSHISRSRPRSPHRESPIRPQTAPPARVASTAGAPALQKLQVHGANQWHAAASSHAQHSAKWPEPDTAALAIPHHIPSPSASHVRAHASRPQTSPAVVALALPPNTQPFGAAPPCPASLHRTATLERPHSAARAQLHGRCASQPRAQRPSSALPAHSAHGPASAWASNPSKSTALPARTAQLSLSLLARSTELASSFYVTSHFARRPGTARAAPVGTAAEGGQRCGTARRSSVSVNVPRRHAAWSIVNAPLPHNDPHKCALLRPPACSRGNRCK